MHLHDHWSPRGYVAQADYFVYSNYFVYSFCFLRVSSTSLLSFAVLKKHG